VSLASNEKAQLWDAFMQLSSDVIALIDKEGKHTLLSPSFEAMLGYTVEEGLGKTAIELGVLDDTSGEQAIRQTFVDGSFCIVLKLKRKDGKYISVECQGTDIGDSQIWIMRDVTERQAFQHARNQLLNSKEEFLNVISRSLKQSVSVIIDLAEVLAESPDDTDPYVDAIVRQARSIDEATTKLAAIMESLN
jgi:PAS domain S-box-containing protein